MTPRAKRNLLTVFVPGLALFGWFLLPGAFAHGVIVGAVSALGLVVAVMVVVGSTMRKRIGHRLQPPPLPVEAWDYALGVQDLAGRPIPMSRYLGSVLVLNFWATWCGPCLAELPSLERLKAATSDLRVELACLSQEKPEAVRRFVETRRVTLPMFVFEGELPECFRSRAIPATFVLDKAGKIVMRHIGAARWDDPSVVTFVRGLGASPA